VHAQFPSFLNPGNGGFMKKDKERVKMMRNEEEMIRDSYGPLEDEEPIFERSRVMNKNGVNFGVMVEEDVNWNGNGEGDRNLRLDKYFETSMMSQMNLNRTSNYGNMDLRRNNKKKNEREENRNGNKNNGKLNSIFDVLEKIENDKMNSDDSREIVDNVYDEPANPIDNVYDEPVIPNVYDEIEEERRELNKNLIDIVENNDDLIPLNRSLPSPKKTSNEDNDPMLFEDDDRIYNSVIDKNCVPQKLLDEVNTFVNELVFLSDLGKEHMRNFLIDISENNDRFQRNKKLLGKLCYREYFVLWLSPSVAQKMLSQSDNNVNKILTSYINNSCWLLYIFIQKKRYRKSLTCKRK